MTPEQRKTYNQKRYTPKRKRDSMGIGGISANGGGNGGTTGMDCETDPTGLKMLGKNEEESYDALSSLERDVLRRTQQAQQALMRQRQGGTVIYTTTTTQQPQQTLQPQIITVSGSSAAAATLGTHLASVAQQQQSTPISTQQFLAAHQRQQQQTGNNNNNTQQQHQIHIQQQPIQLHYTTGGMVVGQHLTPQQTQQQGGNASQPTQLITTYSTHQNA